MIYEAHCSFEVSKLLREKGFDENCSHFYESSLNYLEKVIVNNGYFKNSELIEEAVTAPTHQTAMAWLREEKNLIITIDYDRYPVISNEDEDKTIIGYGYNIQTKGNPEDYYSMSESVYNSYEEAVEAALLYALEIIKLFEDEMNNYINNDVRAMNYIKAVRETNQFEHPTWEMLETAFVTGMAEQRMLNEGLEGCYGYSTDVRSINFDMKNS